MNQRRLYAVIKFVLRALSKYMLPRGLLGRILTIRRIAGMFNVTGSTCSWVLKELVMFVLTRVFGIREHIIELSSLSTMGQAELGRFASRADVCPVSSSIVSPGNGAVIVHPHGFVGTVAKIATVAKPDSGSHYRDTVKLYGKSRTINAFVYRTATCAPKYMTDVSNYRKIGVYNVPRSRHSETFISAVPSAEQKLYIDLIIDSYVKSGRTGIAIVISGPPGCGKSMLGKLLAAEITQSPRLRDPSVTQVTFANAFDWYVNNALCRGYFEGLESRPDHGVNIVQCDEFDSMMHTIHANTTGDSPQQGQPGDKKRSNANDVTATKAVWNTFMDGLADGMLRGYIMIFTTNSDFAEFDALDASYLRPGRITHRIRMSTPHGACTTAAGGPSVLEFENPATHAFIETRLTN